MATRPKRSTPSVREDVLQYLTVKDQEAQLKDRREKLRLKLLAEIAELAEPDADGHIWFPFDEPIKFIDRNGKVHVYGEIKNQLSLIPSTPVPDPELAEALLRKKGLWLTPEQEQLIEEIQAQLPLFDVVFDLNLDSFGDLVYKKKITDKEYQRTLQEQKEQESLIPVEIS